MRKLLFLLVALSLVACGAPSLPPPSLISQVKYIGEIKAGSPQVLAVDQQENMYAAQPDGAIQVLDKSGKHILSLQAQDSSGKRILKKPSGIAVYEDRIYISDRGLHHIAIFSKDGTFIDCFGKRGSDPKEFKEPAGIEVYKGVIYVADYGNDRIQTFGNNGVYLASYDGKNPVQTGSEETSIDSQKPKLHTADEAMRLIQNPKGIAVDYAGNMLIIDGKTNHVKVFNQQGDFLDVLPEVVNPIFVETASDGIYVTDFESYSILKFGFNKKLLFSFGSKGEGRTQFMSLNGLAIAPEGKVYASDPKRGAVQVFLPEIISPVMAWEMAPAPVSTRWISDIPIVAEKAVWDGNDTLYAVSQRDKAILRIKDGKIESSITIQDCCPVAIDIDKAGFLWVVDKDKKRLLKLDTTGKVIMEFGSSGSSAGKFSVPTDIAVSSKGIIFVSDEGNEWVQAFSSDGMFLNALRETTGESLEEPIAIALSPNGTLFVLDADNSTIYVYSPQGKPVTHFGKEGRKPGQFDEPVDLYATDKEVFVLDRDANTIKIFSHDGIYLRQLGIKGKGKGDFDEPTAITSMGNTLFAVSDRENQRMQILANVFTPSPPVATAAKSGMHLANIEWDKNPEPFVTSYTIYRSAFPDKDFAAVGTSEKNSYKDIGLDPEKEYFYRIAALAENGNESAPGNALSVVAEKYTPPMPTGLQAEPTEWSITLAWEQCGESFITGYNIYKDVDGEITKLATSETVTFTEESLPSETNFTYIVKALSSDGLESEGAVIKTATKSSGKPPLEIEILAMQDIFSNTYKIYENEGMGKIKVTNNTGDTLTKIKVAFAIKEFMDFPSEREIESLEPGQSEEFVLKAVFNNKILDVTEDTPVQTEIKASYYENKQEKTYNKNHKVNIYEKHRMMWDDKGRFATFITPKDPLLLDFVRAVVTQYPEAEDNILKAATLFAAMGSMGLTYMQDPSNPYQITSGITDFVDYIQYPRETLQRKSGDCDDLVALISASLESLGIQSLAVEIPGHMFMMFSTGVPAEADGYTMQDMYVIHEEMLWVPIETTLVGKSFITAWEKGSSNYYAWADKELTLLDIRDSWGTFKPASLPATTWRPTLVTRATIENAFNNEFQAVRRINIQTKARKYRVALDNNPQDIDALQQIGIIYAKAGETGEAVKAFSRIIEQDSGHAAALNNLANVHFLDGKFEEALVLYEKAAASDPEDPLVWVNLARCNLRLNKVPEAKEAFAKAKELDPEIGTKYRAMALKLMSTL